MVVYGVALQWGVAIWRKSGKPGLRTELTNVRESSKATAQKLEFSGSGCPGVPETNPAEIS